MQLPSLDNNLSVDLLLSENLEESKGRKCSFDLSIPDLPDEPLRLVAGFLPKTSRALLALAITTLRLHGEILIGISQLLQRYDIFETREAVTVQLPPLGPFY